MVKEQLMPFDKIYDFTDSFILHLLHTQVSKNIIYKMHGEGNDTKEERWKRNSNIKL